MSVDGIIAEVAQILIAHQRFDIKGCRCGWAELGQSHAKHQAQALSDAGLLVEKDKG